MNKGGHRSIRMVDRLALINWSGMVVWLAWAIRSDIVDEEALARRLVLSIRSGVVPSGWWWWLPGPLVPVWDKYSIALVVQNKGNGDQWGKLVSWWLLLCLEQGCIFSPVSQYLSLPKIVISQYSSPISKGPPFGSSKVPPWPIFREEYTSLPHSQRLIQDYTCNARIDCQQSLLGLYLSTRGNM